MKLMCNVIQDLLPLYAEGMVSPDSRCLVEDHVGSCERCRRELAALGQHLSIPVRTETASLQHLERNIRRRRISAAVLTMLVTAAVLLGIFMYLYGPVYLSAEEAVASVTESGGIVTVEFSPRAEYCRWEEGTDPDTGRRYTTVIAARHRWNVLLEDVFGMAGRSQSRRMRLADSKDIWYASAGDGEEDTLLWGSRPGGGRISLPRLVLGYYFLLALGAGLVLLTAAVVLRKKKAGKVFGIFGTLCVCFALSDLLTTGGNWRIYDSYDVPILLTLMVIQTALLSGCAILGLQIWRTNREE